MIPFVKMHGLGNDFVVIDARNRALAIGAAAARQIGDRRRGIGCDQVVVIEDARQGSDAEIRLVFRNSDGTEAGACGNGARCAAHHVMKQAGSDTLTIETVAGRLQAWRTGADEAAVDMGPARLDWREIPLARAMDTLHLDLSVDGLHDPVGVGMGNPHCVFFVPDAEAVQVTQVGPLVERAPLFPEGTNVEFVTVVAPDRLRMRVWERGAGLTQACGSGACAAAVASARRGLTSRRIDVVSDGGTLKVEWRDDEHVVLEGPVATAFSGEFDEAWLK